MSINLCTDQLLLDLAHPGQIAGLSPFAPDGARSWASTQAGRFPVLSGTAEEILVLKPDLVVAGRFTKRATREFIRARGITMEEFDPARSLAEAKRQIIRFGQITGSEQRASARVAELDAATEALKAAAAASRLRILPLARRGWVAGSQTLMTDLLAQAGLANAAAEIGIRSGGIVTLEMIVKLRPDAIVIARDDGAAEDQGRAMLLHPALQELFPPERRIVLPERLTICGGPMLAEAMQLLATQIAKLTPRDAAGR